MHFCVWNYLHPDVRELLMRVTKVVYMINSLSVFSPHPNSHHLLVYKPMCNLKVVGDVLRRRAVITAEH